MGRGFTDVTVLDVSSLALDLAASRIGDVDGVTRLNADLMTWEPERRWDLWHDRAVFHFLLEPHDREGYLKALRAGLKVGGSLVLATFAPEGPEKCSGLQVCRYEQASVLKVLGPGWRLAQLESEEHRTPWDAVQRFNYFRRVREA